MTAIPIGWRVVPKQTPSFYRFMECLDFRSFHGRSMLCLLIDRALQLSEDDKHRYGSMLIGRSAIIDPSAKPRRFNVSITSDEHPETMLKLERYGADNVRHPRFLHLLEVAAGLMYGESTAVRAVEIAPQPPQALSASPLPAPAHQAAEDVPPKSVKPMIASGVIASAAQRDDASQLNAEDLSDLFGTV